MPYLRHLGLGTWSLDALFKASRLGKGVALDALNLGLSVCSQGPRFEAPLPCWLEKAMSFWYIK